jgi:SsrA-binding protein
VSLVNKKATFDYQIIESYEAGIVLTGAEVKAVRDGGVNFAGARVIFDEGKAKIIGLNILKYKYDSSETYDSSRSKEILLHKKEIIEIQSKMRSAGLTLVPVKLYNKGSLIKVQIALVRGKKKYEKREAIKKRDVDAGLARRLKNT